MISQVYNVQRPGHGCPGAAKTATTVNETAYS